MNVRMGGGGDDGGLFDSSGLIPVHPMGLTCRLVHGIKRDSHGEVISKVHFAVFCTGLARRHPSELGLERQR